MASRTATATVSKARRYARQAYKAESQGNARQARHYRKLANRTYRASKATRSAYRIGGNQ